MTSGPVPAEPRTEPIGTYFSPAAPRVLAHRGLALEAPENTLLAFLAALSIGVTHIETDVHASSDGIAIISHDPDLRRLTGDGTRISDLTAAQLGRADLGHGQGFPTLVAALFAFPDARFNIDIKSADAVAPTVDAILRARATARVLVTSFDGRRSRSAIDRLPGVATSASSLRAGVALIAAGLRAGALFRVVVRDVGALQVPERWRGIRLVTPALLAAARRAGVEVHVWTVNDPSDMRRLLALGVDGLVTDRADLALAVLRESGSVGAASHPTRPGKTL